MDAVLLLAGIAGIAVGGLMVFAGGMSDAPEVGDAYARNGCIVAIAGLVSFIAGAAILIHHLAS